MDKKTFEKIMGIFNKMYPNVTVSLNFNSAFELVICLILAAQCTDKRVNEVTKDIFDKYNKPEDFANMDIEQLEKLIKPCGFYRNKAKNIQKASKQIIENFNGIVPNTMENLQTLAGIGRKSANVIMLEAFHNPQGIAVDTHVKRISNRIGLSKESNPEKIEKDLLHKIPTKYYYDANHLGVWHGRYTCIARSPKCNICPISQYCNYYSKEGPSSTVSKD